MGELQKIVVNRVGLVDSPAIRRTILVMKRDPDTGDTMPDVSKPAVDNGVDVAKNSPLLEAIAKERLGLCVEKLSALAAGLGTMTHDEICDAFYAISNACWAARDDIVALAKGMGIDMPQPDSATATVEDPPMTEQPIEKRADIPDDVKALIKANTDALATANANLAQAARREEIVKAETRWPTLGSATEHVDALADIRKSRGEKAATAYASKLDGLEEVAKRGGSEALTKVIGSGATGTDGPKGELAKLIKAARAADPKLTEAAATVRILKANPTLYTDSLED